MQREGNNSDITGQPPTLQHAPAANRQKRTREAHVSAQPSPEFATNTPTLNQTNQKSLSLELPPKTISTQDHTFETKRRRVQDATTTPISSDAQHFSLEDPSPVLSCDPTNNSCTKATLAHQATETDPNNISCQNSQDSNSLPQTKTHLHHTHHSDNPNNLPAHDKNSRNQSPALPNGNAVHRTPLTDHPEDQITLKRYERFTKHGTFSSNNSVSPEHLLADVMAELGNPHPCYRSSFEMDNYFLDPTDEQIAAYDNTITSAVRSGDIAQMRRLMDEGHIMHCSNRFGETILHIACRRGSLRMIKFLMEEGGASIRVRDDLGRTVLHDACWTAKPALDVMQYLIQNDPQLITVMDKRGSSPLGYARRDHWDLWCDFLLRNAALLRTKTACSNNVVQQPS